MHGAPVPLQALPLKVIPAKPPASPLPFFFRCNKSFRVYDCRIEVITKVMFVLHQAFDGAVGQFNAGCSRRLGIAEPGDITFKYLPDLASLFFIDNCSAVLDGLSEYYAAIPHPSFILSSRFSPHFKLNTSLSLETTVM